MIKRKTLIVAWRLLLIALAPLGAVAAAEPDSTSTPPAPVPPYALPWQLRSIIPANVARLDSALSFYDNAAGKSGGFAAASILTGAYKLDPNFALLARLGMTNNAPPGTAAGATTFTNPLLAGLYSFKFGDGFRAAGFLGVTVPIGTGGGNSPDAAQTLANQTGILARSAMDNALFAVNYMTVSPGVDIAYIANNWTVQAEATLLQLMRVGGEQVDLDSARTNFTAGLTIGYAFPPTVALLGELRYQRWLNNNTVETRPSPPIENLSFAVGPRFTFKIESVTLRPGIAYAQGLAGPMGKSGYTYPVNNFSVVFVDLPIIFN